MFRLPERAKLPITEEQKALQEKRRAEAKEVEAKLAQRAKHITEAFEQIDGMTSKVEQGQKARKWEHTDRKAAAASLITPDGEKEYFLTPDEAWVSEGAPTPWDAYLHRVVQYLVSGVDRQKELLQRYPP